MVREIEPLSWAKMEKLIAVFDIANSTCLKTNILGTGFLLNKCAAKPLPSRAYWIGSEKKCVAFFALSPASLGTHQVMEGKKAWTSMEYVRRGFQMELLQAAASECDVMSDTDGMSAVAFRIWLRSRLHRHWWDTDSQQFVPVSKVAPRDRFGRGCSRYHLVLSARR